MHELQPKQTKLEPEMVEKVLSEHNIALVQLPKISQKDSGLDLECTKGDVIKIERKEETYFRVVI
ncbi:DNA-directed RNA polymerase subunit H [archaeon]|jgi:DNA-directed RNA polymerase subunit H (RpoH/RPB5)|nr:DNA-directed RNA polymerase subunit H [archaeon]